MTRSRRSAKTLGANFERRTADYLAATLDDDRIDRRAKTGHKDRGDISGIRAHNQRIVIECKNSPLHADIPAWIREAHTEAGNDDALVGVVIAKRRGVTDPGQQWVHMTVDDLCALITGERHGHRRDVVA
jgi:hypothetical protein